MDKQLQLLYLAHPFPPRGAIAGVRTGSTAKYLARLGWLVRVVTPDPLVMPSRTPRRQLPKPLDEGIEILFTGHVGKWLLPAWPVSTVGGRLLSIVRKAAGAFQIDRSIGWIPSTMMACRHLRPDDVDVILATGGPFSSFSLAERLSRRLGRPFVIDYRDFWTASPYMRRLPLGRVLNKERALLNASAAVTVVGPSMASTLQRRFDLACTPYVISNGYDPEELAAVRPTSFGHKAIVYAGRFYPPLGVITPVFRAMAVLLRGANARSMNNWRFHYYGRDNDLVRAAAHECAVSNYVELHGVVTRHEAIAAVAGAAADVVITSVSSDGSDSEAGIVTGKVFEAIGLGVPVLLIAPFGNDARVVVGKSPYSRCFVGGDTDGIAGFLREVIEHEIPRARPVESYAWPRIAKQLDAVLRCAMEHSDRRVARE